MERFYFTNLMSDEALPWHERDLVLTFVVLAEGEHFSEHDEISLHATFPLLREVRHLYTNTSGQNIYALLRRRDDGAAAVAAAATRTRSRSAALPSDTSAPADTP